MTIKIYDKLLDLIGREAHHMVGSRIAVILGSRQVLTSFMRRIKEAQDDGLTRLEVSITQVALQRYIFANPTVKTCWHTKMQSAMDHLVDRFLNDPRILTYVYRRLSLPTLITLLGKCKDNLLVIGKNYSWIINATTGHGRHFVGTMKPLGFSSCANSNIMWNRVEMFAKMYAAAGSTVWVYSLFRKDSGTGPVSSFQKKPEAHF